MDAPGGLIRPGLTAQRSKNHQNQRCLLHVPVVNRVPFTSLANTKLQKIALINPYDIPLTALQQAKSTPKVDRMGKLINPYSKI